MQNFKSELERLAAEIAALRCANQALIHVVSESGQAGNALTTLQKLTSQWNPLLAQSAHQHQTQHFYRVANGVAAQLQARSGCR